MDRQTDFDDLKDFILNSTRMRMSYIYKPVMLQTVLQRGEAAYRGDCWY
jgi:hypothetical protein